MVEVIKKSEVKYNQAAYQQERINDLMRTINLCWVNPIQYNFEFNDYNYRVIFSVLTSYYREIRVKLNTEKKEIDKIMDNLDAYIERYPILLAKSSSSLYNDGSKAIKFNSKSWKIIKGSLSIYQNKILDAAESYGMGNPNLKDVTKAAIDLG